MSKKYFLFFTIIILTIIKSNSNYTYLFFHKDVHKRPYDIENVFFTSVSTDIYIGSPPKKINIQISTDTPYFVIDGDTLTKKDYSQENSSSFYFVKYGHSYSYRNIYFHAIFFDENYLFEKNKIKLNAMMSWSKYPLTKSDGLIGLQLKDIKFNEKNIFLNQLYHNNIINNKRFSFIYTDENNGILLLGDFPLNKTDFLKSKKIKICENNFGVNGSVFGTIFEKITFNEISINSQNKNLNKNIIGQKNYIAIISNIYYGYIGSYDYNNFVYEIFFKEKINSKYCWIQTIDDDKYFGYVCSKNIDTSSIPQVKFYHKELNYTFEITNEEMWISRNNIKYFLIFFSFNNQYSWTFGEKFLRKYNLIFDGGNNLIGIYYTENNESFNNFNILIMMLIIILVAFGLFIGYKLINKNKNNENDDNKKEEEEIELNLIENNRK